MSVTATITEGLMLVDYDSRLRTVKRIVSEDTKRKGWLEQCNESSLQVKRHFIGYTGFMDETGNEDASISCHVGNGVYKNFTVPTSNKYTCTRDRISISDHIMGEGWEFQTWEVIGKWEQVEGSYYEEDLPETGDAYDPLPPPAS